MRCASGVLLILDVHGNAFSRIWCCFELFCTLEESLPLDIVTTETSERVVHLLSESPLPGETLWNKGQREMSFPKKLFLMGMSIKLQDGHASHGFDKLQILNSMGNRFLANRVAEGLPPCSLEVATRYASSKANAALNSYFALAAWQRATRGGDVSKWHNFNLPQLVKKDTTRRTIQLSLAHSPQMSDIQIQSIADSIPDSLENLNLSFEGCHAISDAGAISLLENLPQSLKSIHLDFLGCEKLTDATLHSLANTLPSGLNTLRVDFAVRAHYKIWCADISTESASRVGSMPGHIQRDEV